MLSYKHCYQYQNNGGLVEFADNFMVNHSITFDRVKNKITWIQVPCKPSIARSSFQKALSNSHGKPVLCSQAKFEVSLWQSLCTEIKFSLNHYANSIIFQVFQQRFHLNNRLIYYLLKVACSMLQVSNKCWIEASGSG